MSTRKEIHFDGLIFELQKVGGISRVWSTLFSWLAGSGLPMKYFERPEAASNLYRAAMPAGLNCHGSPGIDARLRKFLPYQAPNAIFFPSYYRPAAAGMDSIQLVHDCIREDYIGAYALPLLRYRRASIYRSARRLIAISHATRNALGGLYGSDIEKKTVVIPNPIDFGQLDARLANRAPNAGSLQSLPGEHYAVYIGKRSGAKNFMESLELLALDRDLQLIVVGAPFSEDELKRIGSFQPRLRNVGHVSDEDLAVLLTHARFLFLPSLNEGFGYPLAEALYFGCPVLCRATEVNIETTLGCGTYYKDRDDLGNGLAGVLSTKVDEGVRSSIRSAYDIQTVGRRYAELLSDMV